MPSAKNISMDVAVVAIVLELVGSFTFKETQKNATEGFSWWTAPFHFHFTHFGKGYVKHWWLVTWQRPMATVAPCTNRNPRTG